MYHRTPFRQLRQIYSSILALGRLPSVIDDLNRTVATGTARSVEAIDRLACARTGAPRIEPERPQEPCDKATELSAFRSNLLNQLDTRLLCIDVGARWGADSALMVLGENAKLLCFDPDEEECARLQKSHSRDNVEYVALALGADGGELNLTITRDPACSSVYPPMEHLCDQYPSLEVIRPERVISVPSTTIDAYLTSRGMGKPCLFKLDTQGSELDILKGSINNLSQVCMLDIEVEFNPLYQGQALFSEVDTFLRSHGFVLWRLPQLVHYTPKNFPAAETPVEVVSTPPARMERTNPGNGQLFWAQAHYVRSSCIVSDATPISASFARQAAVVASAYGYWDLSLMVLQKCAETAQEAATLRTLMQ